MTLRVPVVMVNGLFQNLQAGDTILVAQSTYSARSQVNGEGAAAIVCGTPVYASAAGSVKRAQANAVGTSVVDGLALEASTPAAGTLTVVTSGVLVLTTTQWDAVAGTTGGLTFNAYYWLDPATVGKITGTGPTTTGQTVVLIGRALSTTELDISIQPYVLL